jgi:predicted nucleic acid-binding protein
VFLLDTNVVSELRKAKPGKADRNVVAWASGVPASSLFVSAITIPELELGVRAALIAATAMVHNMTVVTRNLADFAATGVPTLDPWSARSRPGRRGAR